MTDKPIVQEESRIVVEMTLDQAAAVSTLIDLGVRIHLGQIEEIAGILRMGNMSVRDDVTGKNRPATLEQIDNIEDILVTAKRLMGHPSNSSFGIGNSGVSQQVHRAYETKKVIGKAVASVRMPNTRHHIDHDGLLVRYTSDPAPSARIETPQAASPSVKPTTEDSSF